MKSEINRRPRKISVNEALRRNSSLRLELDLQRSEEQFNWKLQLVNLLESQGYDSKVAWYVAGKARYAHSARARADAITELLRFLNVK